MDFSSIADAVVVTGLAAAIIGMGAVKIAPNVAAWGANKLANFFR
ncbi:hypothetical protein ACW4YW_04715 [Methylobacillus pratensis]